MKNITKNIGMLLLAIWLIVSGLAYFIPAISVPVIMAILAIAAGGFILLNR